MEKMEIEKNVEEAPVLKAMDVMVAKDMDGNITEIPLREYDVVGAGEKDHEETGHKWIDNKADGVKTCDACGAEMRGWAYREKFFYCPICGVKMDG